MTIMIINLRGINALQQLRIDWQESAGLEFPEACLKEMLFLYDVCKALELSIFQAREVLGASAYQMVMEYITSPLVLNHERAQQFLGGMQSP
jgi:hypothetical protein